MMMKARRSFRGNPAGARLAAKTAARIVAREIARATMTPAPPTPQASGTGATETRTAVTPPQRCEPQDAEIHESGIAPLYVDAQRHYGRYEAEVQDRQGQGPTLDHTDQSQSREHGGEHADGAHVLFPVGRRVHGDLLPKMPVGLSSNTSTRMTKETANL